MPEQNTRADSLARYYTGAGSDGGSQSDPDACLGAYRSSTEVPGLSASISSPISNITVAYVAPANGEGSGTLTATGNDTLTWTAPGGSAGSDVTIANGETMIVESASDPDAYVRVTRTSATNLTGAATLTLTTPFGTAVGLDNVSSAEAVAGDDEYRCICLRNDHATLTIQSVKAYLATLGTQRTSDAGQLGASGAGTITTTGSLADWPEQGYAHVKTSGGSTREIVYYTSRTATALTVPAAGRGLLGTSAAAGASDDTIDAVPGIRLAKEAPTGDASTGYAQTIADEDTAPTGVTWNAALDATNGIDIGNLAPGAIYFLWIHRQTPAGAASDASVLHHIKYGFDAA